MAYSALNHQHNRLASRSLYFLLGMLSAGKRLEAVLAADADSVAVESTRAAADHAVDADSQTDGDFAYFCLGLLAFSRQLQARMEAERALMSQMTSNAAADSVDALSGALY